MKGPIGGGFKEPSHAAHDATRTHVMNGPRHDRTTFCCFLRKPEFLAQKSLRQHNDTARQLSRPGAEQAHQLNDELVGLVRP